MQGACASCRSGAQLTGALWAQAGPVIDAGGIFDYARQTGMIKKAA
jgi:hypothetical protein